MLHEGRANRYAVVQIGARRNYAVPRILFKAGCLDRLYTDVCSSKGILRLAHAVPVALRTHAIDKLVARSPVGIPRSLVMSFPVVGLRYALLLRRLRKGQVFSSYLWAAREICKRSLKAGLGDANSVHVFNGAGLEVLQAARKRGMRAVLEQTIAPLRVQQSLDAEEQERHRGWEEPLAEDPSAAAFVEREAAEWESADVITCGSTFVTESLGRIGGPSQKCRVIPYGAGIAISRLTGRRAPGPLRVLVVGLLCLRKGSPYVLDVARRLGKLAQFRMVGPSALLPEALGKLSSAVEVTGAVPRHAVHEHYRWADVFFLPSICEGSAEVCNEALSAGLPVVTTTNAGSIVTSGVDGYVHKIRDVDGMVNSIGRLAQTPDLLDTLSAGARKTAESVTEAAYAERLLHVLCPDHPTGGRESAEGGVKREVPR